ncbi:Hydroxyacylglutathione hydrolase [Halomicronema hongdechloris C2206]|uniref:Hydroxyacylglutathione hydrolase n=1 Tax=Halomicronema hongdechloris C2206 TaxID=1641165 RepID=A0A1Z3HH16_9CYAN|nr:MBL fold metallo-hydrolase [Halomicronema hongdechloris]ASC69619.1 Hydroxyacylglutathione hydrolase [Halomicronema hongdechloris C2206]
MATLSRRRPQNVSGDIYVDSSCIDCDTCRWMAPSVFERVEGQSAVSHQPGTEAERQAALQALLACPTASIGTVEPPQEIRQVQQSFPIPVTDDVYHCGYHAESSFGAASYLIRRPQGNVLVDSPRFSPPLVKQLQALGGVRYLYLTHRDDVADHQRFREQFGCDRILHQDDISPGTRGVEIPLTGQEPVSLAPDLLIIPVPGHTKGHTVLLYENRVLFSGDHLAWSPGLGHLHAFRRACWYSWPELIQSMKKLAAYSFEWVLPGHGRRYHADRATMAQQMQQCIAWMEQVA